MLVARAKYQQIILRHQNHSAVSVEASLLRLIRYYSKAIGNHPPVLSFHDIRANNGQLAASSILGVFSVFHLQEPLKFFLSSSAFYFL